MKTFKLMVIVIWLIVLVISLIMSSTSTPDYLSLICWWFAAGWLFVIWNYRLKDIFSLKISLGMFMVGGTMASFGLGNGGEVLIKFAFIVLSMGFVQSLIEYKKSNSRHVK